MNDYFLYNTPPTPFYNYTYHTAHTAHLRGYNTLEGILGGLLVRRGRVDSLDLQEGAI